MFSDLELLKENNQASIITTICLLDVIAGLGVNIQRSSSPIWGRNLSLLWMIFPGLLDIRRADGGKLSA